MFLGLSFIRHLFLELVNKHLKLLRSFLPVLFDVLPLLEQRQEVSPDQVAPDRDEAKDFLGLAFLVDKVKGVSPTQVVEKMV